MPLPRRPGRRSPFRVKRGRLLGKRRTVVTTKHPHRIRVGKRKIVITLPKQRKKGGKKMPARPRRPVRRPVRKPKAKMRQSAWTPKGAASSGGVSHKPFSLTGRRPGVDIIKEMGYNVRYREVYPKSWKGKKKRHIEL